MTIPIKGNDYTLILSDTAGQEEYDRLRPLAYTDVRNRYKIIVITFLT